jgi:hypothetical protein
LSLPLLLNCVLSASSLCPCCAIVVVVVAVMVVLVSWKYLWGSSPVFYRGAEKGIFALTLNRGVGFALSGD